MRHICLFSWCFVAFVATHLMVGIAYARDITVGIGFSMPPYVIKEDHTGLEVEIIRESFAVMGVNAKFVYLPKLRLPVAFADAVVDCVAANATYDMSCESGMEVFGSDETLVYQNYAIAMKSSGFDLKSVSDLKDKVLLGFNNAINYLGPEYAAMAAENAHYSELADQSLQVRMLYSGRAQVVVSDKRIFLYWRKKMLRDSSLEGVDMYKNIQFYAIFPPSPRSIFFKNSEFRDIFNKGLIQLRKSGKYNAIIQRYEGVELE